MRIVVAGGLGVGKTTFVGTVSQKPVLGTEAVMSVASIDVDDLSATPNKTTTTVAMDVGQISIDDGATLHVFGTPGQPRFWFMWDDLVKGAIGAVVLVDTTRLRDCFGPLDFFEARGVPFVVAINAFDGLLRHSPDDVRDVLNVSEETPVLVCDARHRESARQTLALAVEHAISGPDRIPPAQGLP